MGTRFIATAESRADPRYKQMIVDTTAKDIVYTPLFSGVHGNYLKPSIRAAGLDPDNLPAADPSKMDFDRRVEKPKAWKAIWGAGQGVGNIREVMPAREVVARLRDEYAQAVRELAASTAGFRP
jgi:nitronate monooxygenase